MARSLATLVVVCGIVVACSSGISRERAIQLALNNEVPGVVVVSAESGPVGRFIDPGTVPSERADRMVWAVQLRGDFAVECVMNAAGQSVCPQGSGRKLVLLDFKDGQLVLTESR